MRLKALFIAAVAALSAGPAMAAGYGEFTGDWRNDDSGTSNITRVRVAASGGGLNVRVWGQCTPSDCDWGAEQAIAYSPNPGQNPITRATDLTVTFNPGFAQTILHLRDLPGDRLQYTVFTRFTDGSSRNPYTSSGTLRKHVGGWPGWPPGGGGFPWPPGGGGGGGGGGIGPSPGITLYEHVGYAGGSYLISSDMPNLMPIGWNDIASSIRVSPGQTWEVCQNMNYAPPCRVVSSDIVTLVPGGWNDTISSVRRVTGGGGGGGWPPGGGGGPVTYSTGLLTVPQTYEFDLDEGAVASSPQADLWFQAVNPVQMYLTPRNGATMWVGDGSNRNLAGCASGGAYSSNRVALSSLPVGTYVCVRTNQGRYSQFRVNSLSGGYPKTLVLGYTTWR